MHPFNTAAEITVLLMLGLLVRPAALIPVLPLALAVSMTEELPHPRGITPQLAEPLAAQLLALIFVVVVVVDLLLQTWLVRRVEPPGL